MSKRNRDRSDILSAPPVGKTLSQLEEIDRAIYGDILQVDDSRHIAEPTDIYAIRPDPVQPRRALPSEIRSLWDGNPHSVSHLLDEWWARVNAERGSTFDLDAYLRQKSSEAVVDELVEISEREQGPLETALVQIVDLAASIKRDGLTNPITIAAFGPQYQIETGERRWLAYHLLYGWSQQDEQWSRIPARVMEKASVWRQASENNARADLNAIARSRQLALLLMDLYGAHHFQPMSAFAHEQDFYAQVADGEEWRVPRGKGDLLMNAIGFKNSVQIRMYRALLRLPRDVWVFSDDNNLPESQLRELMGERDTVSTDTVSEKTATESKPTNWDSSVFEIRQTTKRNLGWLLRNADIVSVLDDKKRRDALKKIEALEHWLADYKNKLNERRG